MSCNTVINVGGCENLEERLESIDEQLTEIRCSLVLLTDESGLAAALQAVKDLTERLRVSSAALSQVESKSE